MTNYFAALLLGAKAWCIISSLKARKSFKYHHQGLQAPKKFKTTSVDRGMLPALWDVNSIFGFHACWCDHVGTLKN
jgi:hypothetical protein